MRGSRHAHSNSAIGWGVWIGLMCVCWFLAFVRANPCLYVAAQLTGAQIIGSVMCARRH
jgi:hypothetical protein